MNHSLSDGNHEMDCRTAWLGGVHPMVHQSCTKVNCHCFCISSRWGPPPTHGVSVPSVPTGVFAFIGFTFPPKLATQGLCSSTAFPILRNGYPGTAGHLYQRYTVHERAFVFQVNFFFSSFVHPLLAAGYFVLSFRHRKVGQSEVCLHQ